jgi:Zn-dependent peptidase ImmA (M78 family)/transcriptional regulator with XRE-family HTH domain
VRASTPGFVPERLREAREARGLTAVALTEAPGVKVSPGAISHYENGRATPSPDVLRSLAAALDMPEHFFLRPERKFERSVIFYRSMSSATKTARSRAERRFSWLREIARYLSEYVELPQSKFPSLDLPADPLLLSNDEIEDAAEQVRRAWGMGDGPIANMVLLLENHGAVIARDQVGAETLDSLSEFVVEDHRPYIMVATDKGTAVRWRFDAAHELGHIVLHGHVRPQMIGRPEHHKRIEEQAHRFASAFLLPLASFGEDFFAANLDTLVALKPKWKVSIAMMIMSAHRAGFISDDAARRLWINYSRRGWKRNEPYDESMEAEQPRVLRRSFELVLRNGDQTAEDVTARLALALSDVETLSGLPSGYLGSFSPVALRDPRGDGSVDEFAVPADVIPLALRRTRTI